MSGGFLLEWALVGLRLCALPAVSTGSDSPDLRLLLPVCLSEFCPDIHHRLQLRVYYLHDCGGWNPTLDLGLGVTS